MANRFGQPSVGRNAFLVSILLLLIGSWLLALWMGRIESDQKSLRTFNINADDFDDSIPTTALLPTEVVQMQLDSIRQSDTNPRALVVCYSLASPENRQATGPYSRFASMLRTPPYDLLLLNKDYVVGSPTVVKDEAMVPVKIFSCCCDTTTTSIQNFYTAPIN